MRSIRLLTMVGALALLAACGDKDDPALPPDTGVVVDQDAAPPDGNRPDLGDPDAYVPDLGPDPDGNVPDNYVPSPPTVAYSGKVIKLGAYLNAVNEYSGAVNVRALGVYPDAVTASAEGVGTVGDYALTLPSNGQLVLWTQKLGYFPTYNRVTTEAVDATGKNIYVAENAWLNEIATAHAVDLNTPFACHAPALDPAQQCIYAVVVGRILDDGTAGAGTRRPVGGVTKENFVISYGPQNYTWYTKGPYFLDYTGTSSVTALSSVVYNDGQGNYRGGLYLMFAEIPQTAGAESRDLNISISYPYNGATRYFGPVSVKIYRPYGVSWLPLYETGQPPPMPNVNIDFDTQIYPLTLPVNEGGFGCQGCHTNRDGAIPTGGMNLYGGPEVAYNSLDPNRYPQRVNLANIPESLLLKKPLYEAVGAQDHPIFAFASDQDPAYRLIYTWISEGALRNDVPPPPVSFVNEVRPLLYQPTTNGGIGCYECHVNGVDAATAPAGFYMGGLAEELYAELTAEAPTDPGPYAEAYRVNKNNYPERSLILIKPLTGNPIVHPVKIFSDATDPRYQILYRWVSEGYQNN